jgi:monoamine oxidase
VSAAARRTVAVVGAGLSGLTAADRLQQDDWEVTVLEATGQVGGRVRSEQIAATQSTAERPPWRRAMRPISP